jgi:hypothetical protein
MFKEIFSVRLHSKEYNIQELLIKKRRRLNAMTFDNTVPTAENMIQKIAF